MPAKKVIAERRGDPRFVTPCQANLLSNQSELLGQAKYLNLSFGGALLKVKHQEDSDWEKGDVVIAKPPHRGKDYFLYRVKRINSQSRRSVEIGCQRMVGPFADRKIRSMRLKECKI